MRLNFYFEFPVVDVDAKDLIFTRGITFLISSTKLYRLSKELHPDIEFKAINSHGLNENGELGPKRSGPVDKFSHFYLIIENPDNKKYFVVSYWDKLRGMSESPFWDMENMVELFAADGIQDNERDFRPCPHIKYTPISAMPLFKEAEDRIEEVYKNPKTTPDRLYFKGGCYDFREYMYNDGRIEMDNIRVFPTKFIDKIAKNSINVDINGAAEISCRTLEIMGLQSALIRPKLSIQYHNPLIPDYHYAALKCNDLGNWKEVADAYIERFEDLKKDPNLVQFLSENGRKWYEENATIDAHVSILKKLINFEKLK